MTARQILWYVLVFVTLTNWALAGIDLLRHTSPVVQILAAIIGTIFAVLNRRNRKA